MEVHRYYNTGYKWNFSTVKFSKLADSFGLLLQNLYSNLSYPEIFLEQVKKGTFIPSIKILIVSIKTESPQFTEFKTPLLIFLYLCH